MNLKEIACVLKQAADPATAHETPVQQIVLDSRKLAKGDIFVALAGENFDGHDFIEAAVNRGAIAIICEKKPSYALPVPCWVVPSSLQALADMASYYRQTIHCPIIAVTGSNGKTSVKEMIHSILPKPSHATPGNLNNHIGVPLSLLALSPEDRYAVFELGANHSGEIAYTVAMVKPDVTLINNIGPAHIGEFGSLEGVARAKGEIYQGLGAGGTAVVNNDDAFANFWDNLLIDKKVLRFSLHNPGNVTAKDIRFNAEGCAVFTLVLPTDQIQVALQVPGEHMILNALAAASCCYAVGISGQDIVRGLIAFRGVAGRMTFLTGKNKALIIDDTYNANLRSVLTAIEVLAKRQGQRILVLGDLGELGDFTQAHHEEIGRVAREMGVNLVFTCGAHSKFTADAFGKNAKHFTNHKTLVEDLKTYLDENTTVLIKGSRAAAMENVVQELVSSCQNQRGKKCSIG